MPFKYILIPANSSASIVTKEESSEGGLNNDLLIKSAKEYFSTQSGSSTATTMGKLSTHHETSQVNIIHCSQQDEYNFDRSHAYPLKNLHEFPSHSQQLYSAMIDNASPEERKAIAAQIRKNTPGCEKFEDDLLIQMFK